MNKNIMGVLCLAAVSVVTPAWAVEVETTTVPVSSESILGIRRTTCDENTPTEIAIGVPWLDFNKESITIADVVTTGLRNGDKIKAFDQTKKMYWVWQWMSTAVYEGWVPTMDTKEGFAPDPSLFQVKRGVGLWLVRSAPTNTFTQAGLYTTIPATNQVNIVNDKGKTGSASAPAYTLLFSPRDHGFDLATLKYEQGCRSNDRVHIPTLGLDYTFRKNATINAWGKFVGGRWQKQDEAVIPANTAFWYMSAGGNPTIVW